MKKLWMSVLMACVVAPAMAQTNVGVSIGVQQPGVYGRIDIGNYPRPPVLIQPQPVVIAPGPMGMHQQPAYLYVPPGHQKKWDKHCHRYNACGQPVYFVQESWVRERYEERRGYEGRGDRGGDHDHDHDRGHGKGKHKDKDKDKGRGHDRDDDRRGGR